MSAQTILMVEPNPGILIVARNVLVKAGFAVLAVSNVRHALQLARQRRVDLVLVDHRHADNTLLAGLASTRPSGGLVIVMTAQKGQPPTLQDLQAQFIGIDVEIADILEKPFAPDRLLAAVERATDGWAERTEPILPTEVAAAAREALDELGPHAKTDIFPFAALLQDDNAPGERYYDDATSPGIMTRAARLDAELRSVLAHEGLELDPARHQACVRACEMVLDRESLRGQVAEADPVGDRKLVVAGFIGHMAVDQILQLATTVEAPARCRLEREGSAIEIFYDGSHIVFARQDNMPVGFTLGRMLVAAGHVTDRDIDRTLDPRAGLSGWIGQRLLTLGHIQEAHLVDALRRQTEELFFEVVRWTSGRFSVFAQEPLPDEARSARVELPVHHMLLEGMRRLDEWQRIAARVGDLQTVLGRVESNDEVLRGLRPEDRLVLEHVDGRRTVGDLLRSVARPTFEVFRTIHKLTDKQLVSVRSAS